MNFEQIARAHSEMELLNNKNSKFVVPPTLQMNHPISKCFGEFGTVSKTYVIGEDSTMLSFQELIVDDVQVGSVKRKYNEDPVFQLNTENVLSLSKPAPFGKGNETVFDESVRKGLEISADRIKLKSDSYREYRMNQELQMLAPPGKKLVPKLYKLHMYEPGGHFKKHADTLHAANHYATLIVSLSNDYEGGEFVLEANGQEHIIDLKKSKYVVFLTDMIHQVLPVKSGIRAVLQYDLYLENVVDDGDESDSDDDSRSDCDDELDFSATSYYEKGSKTEILRVGQECKTESIVGLVDQFIDENPNDDVVFLLAHAYPLQISIETLKGSDLMLYDMLKSKYHLELGYVVNATTTDWNGSYEDTEEGASYKDLKTMNYASAKAFKEYITTGSTEYNPKPQGSTHLFFGNGAGFNRTKYASFIEHTGNEAQVGECVYVSAVLAVGPKNQ